MLCIVFFLAHIFKTVPYSLSLIEEKEKRPQIGKNKETEETSKNSCLGNDDDNEFKPSKKSKAQQKRAKKQERKRQQKNQDALLIGEEPKMKKELEENEKQNENHVENHLENQTNNDKNNQNNDDSGISNQGHLAQNKFHVLSKVKKDLHITDKLVDQFEKPSNKNPNTKSRVIAGSDEDDEDGFSVEENEDWEWDYGEEEKVEEVKSDSL